MTKPKHASSIAVFIACLLALVSGCGENSKQGVHNYAAFCSRVLRPGVTYRVGVAHFAKFKGHAIQSVAVQINTTRKEMKFQQLYAEAFWQRQPGEERNAVDLKLLVSGGPNTFDPSGTYRLDIKIVDTLGNCYANSTDVTLSQPPVTTLVQTDKAVYKPGQVVKFRVVNLDESLKPLLADMEVLIKDSKNNLVDKQTHNLTALKSWSDKAVMISEFQLSDMPNEGNWTITVNSVHGSETKSFNVRQYVLPKFSLELTVPSFVHFNDSEFTVGAKVVYTYDKAVEGIFNATIGPFMNCNFCKDKYDLLETFTVKAGKNGQANFTFNLTRWRESLRSRGFSVDSYYTFSVKVAVLFAEMFTGEIKLAEGGLSIYKKRYNIKLNTSQVEFFLPGFDVPTEISLLRPDNQPYTGKPASDVTVKVTYQQRGKLRVHEVYRGPLEVSAAGTGISLIVKIPSKSDFQPVKIEATIAGNGSAEESDTSTIHPFIAVTDDYLKLSVKKSRDDVEMKVAMTDGIRFVYYSVLSRGQLHQWGQFGAVSKLVFTKADLAFNIPEVTVVAFGLAQNGEFVASSVKQKVGWLGGKIGLNSNLTMNTGEPQQFASLRVTAEPESFVFITGIDASVNLLATGQDILQTTVADKYKSKFSIPYYRRWLQLHTTAKILQDNDLILLSNAFYYEETPIFAREFGKLDDAEISTGDSPGRTQVRKFFPETMVWALVKTNSEGKAQYSFRMPDTITSWDLTAFGVANDKQIQTMDEAFKVTTFKNFFIRPVLPYSLIRGEKFLLKVLVFNYRSTDGKVTVALNFTESDADAKVAAGQKSTPTASDAKKLAAIEVTLQASSSGMAIFELTPRSLPSLELTVNATFSTKGVTETDVVIQSVIVEPEGKTAYKTKSVLLSPPANGESRPQQNVSIEYPGDSSDLVSGSEVFSYTIIGDVMGPAMQNIGSLLRLPSGCGEQNMVNFAPAVFIHEYLSNTKQVNNEVKEKALKVMKVGLQRQLTYKRNDGSYSAFGENDEAGSAWLTAFVLSIFAKASSFITIEPDALTGKSVKFLLTRQSTNGEFSEPTGARVLDQNLQGSSAKASHGMTTFICLALLDVDEVARKTPEMQSTLWKDMDAKGSISKCLWYVKSAFDSKPKAFSSYDIALSLYLLRRAQATAIYRQDSLQQGVDALQKTLSALAETKSGEQKYWSTMDTDWGGKRESVEATAWALLSYTLAGNTDESLQIVRWLSNQQNNLGGFQTSQSTVVGIRALAAFAVKSGFVSGDAKVEVTVNGATQTHSVLESRLLVLTQGPMLRGAKARVRNVLVRHASGSGFALVTLSWKYNLIDKQSLTTEWKWANGLGIRLGPSDPKSVPTADQFRLSVCGRANSSEGMLIMRVTNPSGFSVSKLPDASIVTGLKRIEPGSQEIVMYFDRMSDEGVCVTIWWTREVPVLDLSPQLISLQKYYNTEQIVSASYLAPELKSLTQCKACPDCPSC